MLPLPAARWPFSEDEVLTTILGRASPGVLLRCDVHPPLFYLWAAPALWLSPTVGATRALSLLLSAVSAAILLSLAERLWGMRAALASCCLFLLLPARLHTAACGRPFSFAVLLDVWALLLAVSFLRSGRRTVLLSHALLSLLETLTYALFVFPVLGRAFGALAVKGRRGKALFLSALPAMAAVFGFYLLSPAGGGTTPRPSMAFVTGLFVALCEPQTGAAWLGWPERVSEALVLLGALLGLAALLGAWLAWRDGAERRLAAFEFLLASLGLALLPGLSLVQPLGRYAVLTMAPFSLCVGRAVLERRGLQAAFSKAAFGVMLALGLLASSLLPRLRFTLDWPSLARTVERKVGGGVLICDPPSSAVVLRHYLRRPVRVVPSEPVWWTRLGHFVGTEGKPLDEAELRRKMRAVAERRRRVWLLYWTNAPRVWPSFPELLGFRMAERIGFPGKAESTVLSLYVKACPRKRGPGEAGPAGRPFSAPAR